VTLIRGCRSVSRCSHQTSLLDLPRRNWSCTRRLFARSAARDSVVEMTCR
jgi:hypothetical protein